MIMNQKIILYNWNVAFNYFSLSLTESSMGVEESYCQILIYQLSKITLQLQIYFTKMIVASETLFGHILWQINFVK